MARGSNGNKIKYIYLDTDFFKKEKIFLIRKAYGDEGIVIALQLLTWIAEREGWGVRWGETGPGYFAECGLGNPSKEGRVKAIVAKLVEIGYFDAGAYKAGFLTSSRILEDWRRTLKDCHREINYEEIPEYIAKMVGGEFREKVGNFREKVGNIREDCEKNPEKVVLEKIRLDKIKNNTPPTPPEGEGRGDENAFLPSEDGLTDTDREIIQAWNRTFPDGDPRHLPGPPYPINGLFRPNLHQALTSGLTLSQITDAFKALRESDRSWQLHSAVKPENVRFLLTEAGKRKQSRAAPTGGNQAKYTDPDNYRKFIARPALTGGGT